MLEQYLNQLKLIYVCHNKHDTKWIHRHIVCSDRHHQHHSIYEYHRPIQLWLHFYRIVLIKIWKKKIIKIEELALTLRYRYNNNVNDHWCVHIVGTIVYKAFFFSFLRMFKIFLWNDNWREFFFRFPDSALNNTQQMTINQLIRAKNRNILFD